MPVLAAPSGPKPQILSAPSRSACYLCGCSEWKEIVSLDYPVAGKKGKYKLYRCLNCSLEFVTPLPSPENSAALYDAAYYKRNYVAYEKERSQQFENLLDKMSAVGIQGSILDVGCGVGLFTKVARDRGFDVCGVEPSPAGREIGSRVYGLQLRAGLSELVSRRYHTAVLWQVLAHVNDPVQLLKDVSALLEKGGRLIMSFCNWRDPRYRTAMLEARLRNINTIHISTICWRFRKDHLRQLAKMAGLRIEHFSYEAPAIRPITEWKRSALEKAFIVHRVLTRQDQELHAWCRKV